MQYFQKLIQKDLGFSYAIKEPIASHDRADVWALHHGTSKENGQAALVLAFEPSKTRASQGLGGPSKTELARACLLRLKTLRHPDVLKYLTSVEGSDGTIYVATEPATPLATILSSGKKLDRDAIIWGLFTVSRALGFMHQSGLIHARINASTIYVTPSGDWRLGGLEAVTQHQSAAKLARFVSLQDDAYRSPEYARNNWGEVASSAVHAIDSWALGCLMYEAHAGSLTSPDQLRNTQVMPKPLLSAYQKLLSAVPATRAPAGEVPNHPFFQKSKFVELNMFVENLALKGQLEREAFLGKLPLLMDRLPDSFCTCKVLPMLSQSIETGAGASSAFACVAKMKERLSESQFGSDVACKYGEKWYSNSQLDRAVRVEMYAKIDMFVSHMDPKQINSAIFPAMCTAFQDMQTPALRDGAVKAVLGIAPYLAEKNLNSVLMSHFARLQVDPEPAIRTNTTVCLGKLAPKLTLHARSKVLIPAFLRALKDPFPPARAAGVNAILITSEMYNVKDVATRVLPAIVPLLVDNAEDVRSIAFKVTEGFMTRLNSNHGDMSRNAANAPPTSNGATGGRAQSSSSSGWGLSSFTSMTAALLSKSDGNSEQKVTSSATGISSESFRSGGVSSTSVNNGSSYLSKKSGYSSGLKTSVASAPASKVTLKSSTHAAPPSFSSTPLSANAMTLNSGTGGFGSSSTLLEGAASIEEGFGNDDDDQDGWGDMDIKGSPNKEQDEEDMFISMMAPTTRSSASTKTSVGSSKLSMSSRESSINTDMWNMAPPAPQHPKPRPPETSTLESTLSRGTTTSRKKKNSGGDDWAAFLGSAGTSSKRRPGGRTGR